MNPEKWPRHSHHLFLSDVHFGAFDTDLNRAVQEDLFALIGHCQANGIRLHVLGDLFDYWMEYPGHIPQFGRAILERFSDYHRQLGPTLYITGNHDNWTRSAFSEAGFDVEHEQRLMLFDNCRVLLLHGDGLSDPGAGLKRPLVNRILRNSTFVRFYQTILPSGTGLRLMKRFSRMNRKLGNSTPGRLSRWSREWLESGDTDLVITGHDHIPRVETFSFGTYINLGNFYGKHTLAEYTNGTFRLVTWNGERRQITPAKCQSDTDINCTQ